MSELTKRVAVALVGIPLAIVLIYVGGWALGVALAIFAAGASVEVARLAVAIGVRPARVGGAIGAAMLVAVATAEPSLGGAAPLLWLVVVGVVLLTGAWAIRARGVEGRPIEAVAATLLGMLWPGAGLLFALFLRHFPETAGLATGAGESARMGTALVVYAVGLTWINDTCAFFAGRAWGRRKLIPAVSPGKTVVGAVAGVIGAVVVGGLFAEFALFRWLGLPVGLLSGALGGALIAVAAQTGDLVESLFKREAGVKDSGRLFPGHGGVLDRFDALFFTLPAGYMYLVLVIRVVGGGVVWP